MVRTSSELFCLDKLTTLEIKMGNLVEVLTLREMFGWENIQRFVFTAGTIIELDNINIFRSVSHITMNALISTEDVIRFREN
uniref:Recep_L_domain domain-containing protein n=1 Tax=Caenorhabditis tropicalis TaxID=1561998 RepID=A0A1I7UIK9_9PELO